MQLCGSTPRQRLAENQLYKKIRIEAQFLIDASILFIFLIKEICHSAK